jgi:hypothetical protein
MGTMHSIKNNFATNLFEYLELDIVNGPWLAGSMARKLFTNEEPGHSDWDIWVKNKDQENRVTERLNHLHSCRIVFETDNAVTYHHQEFGHPQPTTFSFDVVAVDDKSEVVDTDIHTIQIIKRTHYNTAIDIINNFDFTVCQVATDDGKNFIFGDNTKHDIEHKILRNAQVEPRTDGVIARIIKYIVYGFKPDEDLMGFTRKNSHLINWHEAMDDYESM